MLWVGLLASRSLSLATWPKKFTIPTVETHRLCSPACSEIDVSTNLRLKRLKILIKLFDS